MESVGLWVQLAIATVLIALCTISAVWLGVSVVGVIGPSWKDEWKRIITPFLSFSLLTTTYAVFFAPVIWSYLSYRLIAEAGPTVAVILLGLLPVTVGIYLLVKGDEGLTKFAYMGLGVVLIFSSLTITNAVGKVALMNLEPAQIITEFPKVDVNRLGFTPESVAANQLAAVAQSGVVIDVGAAQVDATYYKGNLAYAASRNPSGLLQTFSPSQGVSIFIDDPRNPRTEDVSESFELAPGRFFTKEQTRGLYQSKRDTIFGEVHTVPNFRANEEGPFIKVATEWNYHFDWSHLSNVPVWDGATLIFSDGRLEHLTPQQIKDEPGLKGYPIYPTELVRLEAQALNYREGSNVFEKVWNGQWLRPNQYKPENLKVFNIPTADGETYRAIALDPRGAKSKGFAALYMVNTHTGQRYIVELQNQMLMDLNTAGELARGATVSGLPAVTDSSKLEYARVAERGNVPVAIYTVVPSSEKSITSQIAIELKRGSRALVFNNNADLLQWLEGGNLDNVTSKQAIISKVKVQLKEIQDELSQLESIN